MLRRGLNDVGLLANVYRYYILSCNDRSDTHYVSKLRNLLRIYGGLSAEEWHDVADGLARDCARNIIDRIKYQPEITTKGGTQRHSSWRNPAYEAHRGRAAFGRGPDLLRHGRLPAAAIAAHHRHRTPRISKIDNPRSDAIRHHGHARVPVYGGTWRRQYIDGAAAHTSKSPNSCAVSPQCLAMRRPAYWRA